MVVTDSRRRKPDASVSVAPQRNILSRNELDQIIQLINISESQQPGGRSLDSEYRRQLHVKSQQRVKKWTNTVEANRKKKLEKRQRRLDEEEAKRQRLYEEEECIQAEARKATVEKTQRLLLLETDRYKTFMRSIKYCDVLAQCGEQLKLNAETAAADHERQKREWELQAQREREFAEQEAQHKEKAKNNTEEFKKVRSQMFQEFKEKRVEQINNEVMQGKLLLNQISQETEEKKKTTERQKKENRKALQETREASERLKQKWEEAEKKEKKEGKVIKTYELEIERKSPAMREEEQRRETKKVVAKTQIPEDQTLKLKAIREAKLKERLGKHAAEIQPLKGERKEQESREFQHMKQQQTMVDQYREEQLALKQQLQDEERKEAMKGVQEKMQAEEFWQQNEMELEEFRKQQKKEKENREQKERQSAKEAMANLLRRQEEEEREFNNFAENIAQKQLQLGHSAIPIYKAIREHNKNRIGIHYPPRDFF